MCVCVCVVFPHTRQHMGSDKSWPYLFVDLTMDGARAPPPSVRPVPVPVPSMQLAALALAKNPTSKNKQAHTHTRTRVCYSSPERCRKIVLLSASRGPQRMFEQPVRRVELLCPPAHPPGIPVPPCMRVHVYARAVRSFAVCPGVWFRFISRRL